MATAAAARNVDVPKVVSESEWLGARLELLIAEKEFDKQRDALAAKRRQLPWTKVEKNYVFEGERGRASLSDLFRDKTQLITYHFMLAPGWAEGCPGCSFLGDHFDGALAHLNARDVAFTAVSRAPLPNIAAFRKRMAWRFPWVSSHQNSFNFDYRVSFRPEDKIDGKVNYNYGVREFPSEEAPGLSVFYKNPSGQVFHTYSTYARGLDIFLGTYNFLDVTPKGRDEAGYAMPMTWVRHHDRYDDGYVVDPAGQFHEPVAKEKSGANLCCSKEAQADR